jgi:folate-binding protein YgfZ
MSQLLPQSPASMSLIASYLGERDSSLPLRMHLGRQIVQRFTSVAQELRALLSTAAVFDLGYRRLLSVRGADQVRWLNGMITNTVKDLAVGHSNYSFVLNAQGKIQGDLTAYRCADHILLETDESQADSLFAHLDHYIIMDDVELQKVEEWSAFGVAGPNAAAILEQAGLPAPSTAQTFAESELDGERCLVAYLPASGLPRFTIWIAARLAPVLWAKISALATAAGADALEALRLLEAVPQYGIDFTDKHLPQEVDAARSLNFNKGCYLGQEIVERIRSRATVHRGLRQLELEGTLPAPPAAVTAGEQSIGEISSVAEFALPGGVRRIFGLGILRNEPVERGQELKYEGGSVRVLEAAAAAGLQEALKRGTAVALS